MSLARRVTLLFTALFAVIALVGALIVIDVVSQRQAQRDVTRLLDASLSASHRLAARQAALAQSLSLLLQTRDAGVRAEVSAQLADRATQVSELLASAASDPGLEGLIGPLSAAIDTSRTEVIDPMLAAVDSGRMTQARAIFASEQTRANAAAIGAAIQSVYDGIAVRRASVNSELDRTSQVLLITLLLSALTIAVAWIAVLRILRRGVLAPVDDVRASLRSAAQDRHQPIEVTGPEEIASLAADAERMRRELVRQADAADAARLAMLQDAPLVAALEHAMRPTSPDVDWLRVHGTMRAGEGVIAGDWWDAIARPDGSIAIVLADVSGHGVGAGTAAVRVRAVLDAALASGASPQAALDLARHALASSEHIVTVVIAIIDSGGIRWANAGHPAPIIVDSDTTVRRCTPTGPLLSRLDAIWTEEQAPFPPGSVLVAFTDGLTEAPGDSGSDIDEGELVQWIRSEDGPIRADPRELTARVVARARRRSGSMHDDVTVLSVARPTR